jgi:hypothetical protein
MINLNEIPQDKKGKGIALNAISSQFLQLAALISTGDIKKIEDVEFYCWGVINAVTKELGE